MEIERKYIVASLPEDLQSYPHKEIEQSYLCLSPTIRIRMIGDRYVLTVKEHQLAQTTAAVNREEEFNLTKESYAQLVAKCIGNKVEKTRYFIPLKAGLTAELDLFHGAHEGLRMVEVEFPTLALAESFVPPHWFGDDVSGDYHYTNSYLSQVK